MLSWIIGRWGHVLVFTPALFLHRMPEWAALCVGKGAPYHNVCCFIDGTLFKTTRPNPKKAIARGRFGVGVTADALQRAAYNGHKRHHGIKYHAVVAPNGLSWAHGPCDGRRHDLFLFNDADMWAKLAQLVFNGQSYLCYGDSAYPAGLNIMGPFPRFEAPPGSAKAWVNSMMSKVRTTTTEWIFKEVNNLFQTIDWPRWQRQHLTVPDLQFRVAFLFQNLALCVRGGGPIPEYFQQKGAAAIHIPTAADYLNGIL
jgi:hypothetical protein